jgi:hypothetical protein
MTATMRCWGVLCLLMGCGGATAQPADSSKPVFCGIENDVTVERYDRVARDCWWEAYERHQPAVFSASHVHEGSRFEYRLEVVSPAQVRVVLQEPTATTTRTVACRTARKEAVPGVDRYSFVLDGCDDGSSGLRLP